MSKEIAIVTGGASGIGLAISKELMNKDIQVVAADINEDALNEAKKANELFDGKRVDVTNESDVKEFVDYVVQKYGKIDYSFQVAGASKSGLIIDQPLADWNFTINLVLNGVFLFIKYVGKQMKKQNGGKLVNISSLNGDVPSYYAGAYSSAKAAVNMLTKNAALELADYHVNVNAILPGLVDTRLTKAITDNEELDRRFKERIPAKRPATPEEIAKPAVFLASEGASYITGTTLVVDGGWEITGYQNVKFQQRI